MVAANGDKVFVHVGIGGAGNVVDSSKRDIRRPSHTTDPQSFREEFGSRRFSTGIGGSGNITMANQLERQNDVEETARLLYDMQAPGIVLSDDSYYTGIGGFANKHHPTETEIEEARQNNDNIRRQNIANINRRRDSLASSVNDSPSSSWNSRRMSVTESMKDFFKARKSTKT